MRFHLFACALAITTLSCGDGGGIVTTDTGGSVDAPLSDQWGSADMALPDDSSTSEDAVVDVEVDAADAADAIGPGACEPGDGCFGETCGSADDCLNGICTMHLGDKICSKTCDTTCPKGWSCTLVGAGASDGQYVCMSNFSHLCLPCVTAEGCFGDTPNACVTYGDGLSFCGGACDLETPCPSGYSCQEVATTAGVESFQCVSTAGVCLCSDLAIASSLATPCQIENEHGTCTGVRACVADGLSDCDAAEPAPEVCNDIDDNCDGDVDEDTCDDGNACTVDSCLGAAGCEHVSLDEGECLDGDACTIADHCEAGLCVGTPVDCDDSNPCTEDACDGLGGCSFENNAAACDDGNDCTLGELCSEGNCLAEVELNCDDGNPCTDDACDPVEGCAHTANTEPCDDGNACTQEESCEGGACVLLAMTDCDDGNPCTTDGCTPQGGCSSLANDLPCDDLDACTLQDACSDSTCVAGAGSLNCNDGEPCTVDSCDAALGCQHQNDDGSPCEDGNVCTLVDTCAAGLCSPGEALLDCDDGNPCTADSCDLGVGCQTTHADGNGCDDGNSCTADSQCEGGACKGLAATSCDDGNPCTDDACDPLSGCTQTANSAACDDGDACSVGDVCADGGCVSGSPLPCDDGNDCTDTGCDPIAGCTLVFNSVLCDDGNVCTEGDHCAEGACTPESMVQCNDGNPCTDDVCDLLAGCTYVNNALPCDDLSACTNGDSCTDGTCSPGPLLQCDDDLYCNGQESCDAATGCVSGEAPGLDDGIPCTTDLCVEDNDLIVHLEDDSGCVDDDVCNGAEICDAQAGCLPSDPLDCIDAVACTFDSCHSVAGCQNVPSDAACDDDNPCTDDSCDAQTGCQHVFVADDTPCLLPGGTEGACQAAICVSNCDPTQNVYSAIGIPQVVEMPECASLVTLEVYGAEGGKKDNASGGDGAIIKCSFTNLAGKFLQLRVGIKGADGNCGLCGGGGGGGSFAWIDGTDEPLIIAGGGGGSSYQGHPGDHGLTTKQGGGGGYFPVAAGQGGHTDNGGGGGTGAGGGGWLSDGGSNNWAGGGKKQGGAGGATDYTGYGGYGGGGAAYHGGGGGGGYTGGSGGTYSVGAGGGGSICTGQLLNAQSGAHNGSGKIVISIE